MAFSGGEADVGKFGIGKVMHLASLILKSWWILFRNRPCYLYYPPASPNLVPVLRDIMYLFAVRPFSRGIILHYHAGGLPAYIDSLNPVLRFLAHRAYGRAQASIEIAKSGIDPGEAFSSRRKFRVSNGIDVPDMLPSVESCNTDEPPSILYMAGLRETKGVMDIVHTAKELKARNINVIFDVAGPWQEEDTRQNFEDAIASAGVKDRIVMHGRVTGTEKWALYRDASLFFFPSYYESENFPLVLIEAMAFGLPVVATRWRGIPEMVVEGETGVLCDLRSPGQFADALGSIISDTDRHEVMSAAARERYALKYTRSAFLDGMRTAFEAVIGEERSRK